MAHQDSARLKKSPKRTWPLKGEGAEEGALLCLWKSAWKFKNGIRGSFELLSIMQNHLALSLGHFWGLNDVELSELTWNSQWKCVFNHSKKTVLIQILKFLFMNIFLLLTSNVFYIFYCLEFKSWIASFSIMKYRGRTGMGVKEKFPFPKALRENQ